MPGPAHSSYVVVGNFGLDRCMIRFFQIVKVDNISDEIHALSAELFAPLGEEHD